MSLSPDRASPPSSPQRSPPATTDEEADDELSSDMSSEAGPSSSRGGSSVVSVAPSTYSYSSAVDHQTMLKEAFGRELNATNEVYMLPADATEHSRLDIQHEMLKKKMGGIFVRPEAVRRAMAPRPGQTPAALDIGTGSGSWAVDFAKLFPEAEVVGLDLVPAILKSPPPPNCRFECDDVNLGLAHFANCFDVVHFRCVGAGVTKYRDFLDEVVDILRPGGVFLVVDGDMKLVDENFRIIDAQNEGDPGFTWTHKMVSAASAAIDARNDNAASFYQLPEWLAEMEAWEETGIKYYYIPIGPWEENMSERDRYVAELMRQDLYRLTGAFRPLLLSHGYFAETVDKWTVKVHDELAHLKKKMYLKVRWSSCCVLI